ncbi:endothelial lipase-like [Melitaea cinxia]|uniref:endothelial lipase-like n=1 Tax=Melitaea cinxia TaxID=113334 RepID=UPI001E27198F|nr:endothelial lipase-like [Melitaea cinxia]
MATISLEYEDNYTVFSLENPSPFLCSSFYKHERKTVFYVFGFGGKSDEHSVKGIVPVYLNRANICLLNWEKEASTGVLGNLAYGATAVPNARKIGKRFGKTLLILNKNGLNLKKVHVIGFSLGAQLSGYAGREVRANGKIIGRITGLDPAGPLFDGIVSLRALSASDASFVDIVHTNPGKLGIDSSVGTVDFWPNCQSSVQPGCEIKGRKGYSKRNSCSHARCWRYFTAAIERPSAFIATFAEDCLSWKAGVRTNKTVYMGDDINLNARGNFYLETNSAPPFGFKKEDCTLRHLPTK